MKKVNFILPYFSPIPGGGLKMMYEYANRLSENGYDVAVYHPVKICYFNYPANRPFLVRQFIRFFKYLNNARPKWINLNDKVQCKFISNVTNRSVRNADSTIVTYWATAYELEKLAPSKGKKINFIQGYEIWAGSKDEVHKSYNLENVENVVVSDFLAEIVMLHSSIKPLVIYNSVDEKFKITNPIENRNPSSIVMLYSTNNKVKGTSIGLEALTKAKERASEIVVDLFGVAPKPDGLPSWVTYQQLPEKLEEIYNRNSIFLAPNISEGWNLAATESMSCGCALVCTNIPGHSTYAHDYTSVRVKVSDSEALTEAILEIISNNEKRIALATSGNEYVKQFQWNMAIEQIIKAID